MQELIAALPQPSDQDWDMTADRGTLPDVVREEKSFDHNETPTPGVSGVDPTLPPANKDFPKVTLKDDGSTTEAAEPSASEEQLPGAVEGQE